jgi:hypothetical protein
MIQILNEEDVIVGRLEDDLTVLEATPELQTILNTYREKGLMVRGGGEKDGAFYTTLTHREFTTKNFVSFACDLRCKGYDVDQAA